jgi:hypothetical protein
MSTDQIVTKFAGLTKEGQADVLRRLGVRLTRFPGPSSPIGRNGVSTRFVTGSLGNLAILCRIQHNNTVTRYLLIC